MLVRAYREWEHEWNAAPRVDRMRIAFYVLSAYALAVFFGAWTELGLSGALIMSPIAILAVLALRESIRRTV